MRALVVRLSSLGDVVCTLPIAAALKAGQPDTFVDWVVDPRFAGIARSCRSVDRVIEAKPGWKPSSWPVLPDAYDVAIDGQGLFKSAIVVGRATAKQKVGFHWQREGARFFSAPIRPDPSSLHVVDQYVDIARAVGGVADRAEFDLAAVPEAAETVRALLAENGVSGRFAVINAGAGWASKRWSPSSVAYVVDGLESAGIRTVCIGSKAPSDREAFDQFQALAKSQSVDLLGKTSVEQLVALISIASVHLGGDTGSTHIAAALGVPAVGLYGITNPERVCPYGQRDNVFYRPEGITGIAPEPVLERMLQIAREL